VLVELRTTPEVLLERLSTEADGRPLLAGEDLETRLRTTYTAREDRYAEVADVTVDAGRSVDEVVEDIVTFAREAGDVLTPSEHEQVMP
jgi:shikimate kinase